MKTRDVVFGGCLLPLLLLIGGCTYLVFFSTTTEHDPPRVIGVRKDALGNVVQQITFQSNSQRRGLMPGPHGPTSIWNRYWYYCDLLEPGKPDRELVFLRDLPGINAYKCHPVEGTPLWAMLTVKQPKQEDWFKGAGETRAILLFDETHILHHTTIDYEHDWKRGGSVAIAFRDGNHTVVYRSAKGWKSLDVMTGRIAPIETPKKLPDALEEGT